MKRSGFEIRVLVAAYNQLFLEGLNIFLNADNVIRVVGQATDFISTVEMIEKLEPDIALIDMAMMKPTGAESLSEIMERDFRTKLLLIATSVTEEAILRSLKEGARGYISRRTDSAGMIRAIKGVYEGEIWADHKILTKVFEEFTKRKNFRSDPEKEFQQLLTMREKEVLGFVSLGHTNKEIAQALFISEKSVKRHVYSIFQKLQVNSRTKAANLAIKRGLLNLE